jgi:hypothetical protein
MQFSIGTTHQWRRAGACSLNRDCLELIVQGNVEGITNVRCRSTRAGPAQEVTGDLLASGWFLRLDRVRAHSLENPWPRIMEPVSGFTLGLLGLVDILTSARLIALGLRSSHQGSVSSLASHLPRKHGRVFRPRRSIHGRGRGSLGLYGSGLG